MSSRRSRVLPGVLRGAVVWLTATACFGPTAPVEIVTWDAELIAAPDTADPLSGSVAMVIGIQQTQMGISVRDAPADASLGWAVREGTCADLGNRVGPAATYPAITVSASGGGASETILFRRIATRGPYAGVVYEDPAGSGRVLACADLEARD